jgi:hypothetical protein
MAISGGAGTNGPSRLKRKTLTPLSSEQSFLQEQIEI